MKENAYQYPVEINVKGANFTGGWSPSVPDVLCVNVFIEAAAGLLVQLANARAREAPIDELNRYIARLSELIKLQKAKMSAENKAAGRRDRKQRKVRR